MKLTIRDLSKLIGYSPATISNALNNKGKVSLETVEKIYESAKYYGYLDPVQINKIRLLIYKHSGLMEEDISSMNQLLDGVQTECKRTGIEIRMQYLDRESKRFEKDLEEALQDDLSALIVIGFEIAKEDMMLFGKVNCPMVILGNWDDEIQGRFVSVDYQHLAEKAVSYLFEKGHRQIGHLKNADQTERFAGMEQGYR